MQMQPFEFPSKITHEFLASTLKLYRKMPDEELIRACSYFGFSSVQRSDFAPSLTVGAFLQQLLPALHSQVPISFRETPFLGDKAYQILEGVTTLQPLLGVNVARISDSLYFLWTSPAAPGSAYQMGVSVLIIDINKNTAIAGCTGSSVQFSTFQIFWYIFSRVHSIYRLRDAGSRHEFLSSLKPAFFLSQITDQCPLHIGHYILNNLGHLSHLESLNLLHYYARIYRPSGFDYFDDELAVCFREYTRLIAVSRQTGLSESIQDSLNRGCAVVCSRGSTLTSNLWRTIRFNLTIPPPDLNLFSVCIGIRGGSREALNLDQILRILAQEIHDQTGLCVNYVLDGMSASINNDKSTTAMLSSDRELVVVEKIQAAISDLPFVSLEPVVGLRLVDQLRKICKCRLAFGHLGGSTFKYMYLSGLDCIVHGHNEKGGLLFSELCHDETWSPIEYYMGSSYVKDKLAGESGPLYANYVLSESLCANYFRNFDFCKYLPVPRPGYNS